MNGKIVLTLLGALALAASCNKDVEQAPEFVEIKVSSEAATRTALDGNSVVWSDGDRMMVFSSGTSEGKVFRLFNGAGTTNGTFFGEQPAAADNYFAAYPATATYNGASTFTYTMPAEVAYTRGTFAPGTNPMLSSTKDAFDGSFSMKNLCGVMRLKLKGTIEVSRLELTFNSYVSGSGHCARGGNTLTMDGSSDADKKVAMTFASPVQLSDSEFTEFYFVLPPAEYDGLSIKAILPDNNSSTKAVSSIFTITRSQIATLEGTMPAPALSSRPELQVWSFNITCQKNDDNSGWSSSNYWSQRKAGVYAFFNAQSPDIIGTQECEYRQRVNILDNTSGYAASAKIMVRNPVVVAVSRGCPATRTTIPIPPAPSSTRHPSSRPSTRVPSGSLTILPVSAPTTATTAPGSSSAGTKTATCSISSTPISQPITPMLPMPPARLRPAYSTTRLPPSTLRISLS